MALGVKPNRISGSVRFSSSRNTTTIAKKQQRLPSHARISYFQDNEMEEGLRSLDFFDAAVDGFADFTEVCSSSTPGTWL